MLIFDELDQLFGPNTGLITKCETFREELDEAEFEGIAHEPKGRFMVQQATGVCGNARKGSLESHRPFHVTSQIHDFLPDRGDERVSSMLPRKVVS